MSKYKYILPQDYRYNLQVTLQNPFEGKEENGKLWVEISKQGILTVKAGYAWDGATLAPDFPETYYPTLVHDALYQFLERGMPLTRKQIDDIFLRHMEENNFALAKVYYRAVRWFGGIFVKITR